MNKTERILLDLLGRSLFSSYKDLPRELDWDELYSEAFSHRVLPLVYSSLTDDERAAIPAEAKAKWDQRFLISMSLNERILYEQSCALRLFEEQNIPCVVLKGSGAAASYPDPSLRAHGDIDILVLPEDRERAITLLMNEGYHSKLDGDIHMLFIKNRVILELHKEPVGLSHNENENISAAIRAFLSDIVEKRQMSGEIPIPSDAHLAIILILHKAEHFLSGELGLRQMCDFAVFIKDKMTSELWEELAPVLESFGLLTFTRVMARACVEYLALPAEYAEWAGDENSSFAAEVIERILESGNFGMKAGNQYGQRLFDDSHSTGRIGSFFKVLGSVCRSQWSPCEKHPILMPIAPFVVYGKYLRRRMRGERNKLHPIALYKRAGTRQKLYHDLKPFVIENETEK